MAGMTHAQQVEQKSALSNRLPESPRSNGKESFFSYCTRLRQIYGLSMPELMKRLDLPTRSGRDIDPAIEDALPERLAIVTGRPQSRFDGMAYDARYSVLPPRQRSAYCPHCWQGRRRADAAYLDKRWDYAHVFFCDVHGHSLLHEKPAAMAWQDWFKLRGNWCRDAEREIPAVWIDLCASLKLDAAEQWQRRRDTLTQFQLLIDERGTYVCSSVPSHSRALMDLAFYVQVEWDPAKRLAELGPAATTSVYNAELCYAQALCGTLGQRLRAVLIAAILLEALRGRTTALSTLIFADCRTRRNTNLECWWIRRRVLRWDRFLAEAFLAAVDMRLEEAFEYPPFDSCRQCTNTRVFDLVDLSLGRTLECQYDNDQAD